MIRPAAAVLCGSLTLLLASCDGPGISGPGPVPDVRPYVTGAAAENLGADGLFVFPAPVSPSGLPIITPERARELAASEVLSFGPALEKHWEEDRGRSIDITRLRAEPRVFFASTPYAVFPDGFHPAFRRVVGPYYLVRMGTNRGAELISAVSAYNTDVGIAEDGRLHLPVLSGMHFVTAGIPLDSTRAGRASPLTPEHAVVLVSRLTGARVSMVPELMLIEHPHGPLYPVWKLTLEKPVRVRTMGGSRTVDAETLYLGRAQGRELLIPAAEQPSFQDVGALRIGPDGEESGHGTARVAILPGRATVFEPVTVVRN
ncbi:MAG TPA: hypothetical protein VGB24_21555 [Longimicrobium sp.]